MKTLLILRHAKSRLSSARLDDFDRPLNSRGRTTAPAMGAYQRDEALVPDLVLCSAACRARETWDLVSQELQPRPPVEFHRSLYLASAARILQAVQRVANDVDRLLVIAHNPGIERFALQLAGPDTPEPLREDLQTKFPTAALAVVTADVRTWQDLAFGQARLIRFVKPRDLK